MHFRHIFGVSALLAFASVPAQAGVLGDDLSRCMVTKLSDTDRTAFMAWMFSAISSDPQLQQYTTLDRAKRDKISAGAAAVIQRMLLVDCRKETIAAMKAEGADVIAQSFGQVGRAATEQLFHSREAQAELDSLGSNFDEDKFNALAREAGIPEKKTSKD